MHPLTRKTINEAIARGAALDLVTHFDAVAALDRAAVGTQRFGIQEEADWLDRPVVVGHGGRAAVLRPMSLAGHLWFEEATAGRWFDGRPLLENMAAAWALARGRDPDALRAASSGARARVIVWIWARTRACSLEALLAAARRVADGDREPPAELPRKDRQASAPGSPTPATEASEPIGGQVGRMLARLCHEFGQTEDYWLYGPHGRVMAALDLLRREAEAMAKAARKSGAAADPSSPEVLAFRRWREAAAAFLAAVCPAEDRPHEQDIQNQRPAKQDETDHE